MKKPTKVTEKKTPTSFRDRLGRLFSMFTSIHTLYFFLISICMTWNVYNTYQHRVLAERQWKSEMRLAQFVSSPPARRPDEQALRRVSSRTNDSVEDLSQVRVKNFPPDQLFVLSLFIKKTSERHFCPFNALPILSLAPMNIDSNWLSRLFPSFILLLASLFLQ